ncbi:hypothetical protein BC829DRAFT_488546 [Chytridium lagenaria]|nr:hypothetical protein BC829DRAFT_488546 [Chytridium lagenaria]
MLLNAVIAAAAIFSSAVIAADPFKYTPYIVDIIREAAFTFQKVKAIGSLHSSTDIICTDGIAAAKTVTVGAGLYLSDLLEALEAKNLMLEHFPAFGGITVGGAIATGAHGSTVKRPATISDQVVQLTLVDGLSRTRVIKDADDLNLARVHLGLLGVVTEVVLKSPFLTSGGFTKELVKYDYFYMYWFPSVGQITISNGTYIPTSTPGNDFWTVGGPSVGPAGEAVQGLVQQLEAVQTNRLTDIWCGIAQRNFQSQFALVPSNPYFNASFAPVNPAVGFGRRIMNNFCKKGQCAWDLPIPLNLVDISIAIPVSSLAKASTAVKEILKQYPACFSFGGIFIRFAKGSQGVISTANGADTAYFEIFTERRLKPEVDARLDIDAISAIAQNPYLQSKYLYKNHPGLTRFGFSAVTSFDPFGMFHNDWSRRVFLAKDLPRGNGCALEDNCFCKADAECTTGMKCVKEAGWSVCRYA